jgi:hypothetical protein
MRNQRPPLYFGQPGGEPTFNSASGGVPVTDDTGDLTCNTMESILTTNAAAACRAIG